MPGDLIVFLGMVAGQRGICLVVSVDPDRTYGLRFKYLSSNGTRLRDYRADWSSPNWEHISED